MGIKSQKRRNKQYELSILLSEMWAQRNYYNVDERVYRRRTYVSGMWRSEERRVGKREIDSMVCRSIDKTGDFYRSFN